MQGGRAASHLGGGVLSTRSSLETTLQLGRRANTHVHGNMARGPARDSNSSALFLLFLVLSISTCCLHTSTAFLQATTQRCMLHSSHCRRNRNSGESYQHSARRQPPRMGISSPSLHGDGTEIDQPEDVHRRRQQGQQQQSKQKPPQMVDRAAFLRSTAAVALLLAGAGTTATPTDSASAIGDLFEFQDQSRFAQHATIQVTDMAAAVKFWTDGVGMEVLRKGSTPQSEIVVLGFGPEALQQPPDFRPGVSSFAAYGGHFSLELNAQKANGGMAEEEEVGVFYEPGNGFQCLQIAVDSYRISSLIKAGAIVESGYGYMQMLAPGGLRVRLLSGSRRDPPMFMVLKVKDLARSIKWYTNVAGMSKMPYPRARLTESIFEPQQPKDSVFMAYEGQAFGVVLVPAERGETIVPGAIISLAVLVEGVEDVAAGLSVPVDANCGVNGQTRCATVSDPDGYAVKFVEFSDWRQELPPLEKAA